MVKWDPEKLTDDLGHYAILRLGLPRGFRKNPEGFVDMEFMGIDFEFRFENQGEKVLRIDVLPFKKAIDGLTDYVNTDVQGDLVFSNGHVLAPIGKRREFGKYSERLELYCVREGEKEIGGQSKKVVSVFYKVKSPFLKLNHDSFRDTTFSYALAPLLSWAQRKK